MAYFHVGPELEDKGFKAGDVVKEYKQGKLKVSIIYEGTKNG